MYECWVCPDIQCNHKRSDCMRGNFPATCHMGILKQLYIRTNINRDHLKREGMEMACHVLLHKHFLARKHDIESTTSLLEAVEQLIVEAKANGKEWYEIGWENV